MVMQSLSILQHLFVKVSPLYCFKCLPYNSHWSKGLTFYVGDVYHTRIGMEILYYILVLFIECLNGAMYILL